MALVQRYYHQLGLFTLALLHSQRGHLCFDEPARPGYPDRYAGPEAHGARLSQRVTRVREPHSYLPGRAQFQLHFALEQVVLPGRSQQLPVDGDRRGESYGGHRLRPGRAVRSAQVWPGFVPA